MSKYIGVPSARITPVLLAFRRGEARENQHHGIVTCIAGDMAVWWRQAIWSRHLLIIFGAAGLPVSIGRAHQSLKHGICNALS